MLRSKEFIPGVAGDSVENDDDEGKLGPGDSVFELLLANFSIPFRMGQT